MIGNAQHTLLKAAYSFYNVANKTPLEQLMTDALILARKLEFDVFNALNVMENDVFLKNLKFGTCRPAAHRSAPLEPLVLTVCCVLCRVARCRCGGAGIGDGHLQYYLYNWRCPEMQPKDVGLVLL